MHLEGFNMMQKPPAETPEDARFKSEFESHFAGTSFQPRHMVVTQFNSAIYNRSSSFSLNTIGDSGDVLIIARKEDPRPPATCLEWIKLSLQGRESIKRE
jgi:hypothetical protein